MPRVSKTERCFLMSEFAFDQDSLPKPHFLHVPESPPHIRMPHVKLWPKRFDSSKAKFGTDIEGSNEKSLGMYWFHSDENLSNVRIPSAAVGKKKKHYLVKTMA